MTSTHFHDRTKQISAANPLWGAINPEQCFTIAGKYIMTFDEDENGIVDGSAVYFEQNPHYGSELNLPIGAGITLYDNRNYEVSYVAHPNANVGAGIFNSLETMAQTLNLRCRSYIEGNALHLILDESTELRNADPEYDFIGILGLQLY